MFKCSFLIGGNEGHFSNLRSMSDLHSSIMRGEWLCSDTQALECLKLNEQIGYTSDELMLVEIEANENEIGMLMATLQRGDRYTNFDFNITNWARIR